MTENFEKEVFQRITRLESKFEDLNVDIKEIKEKLNGYLEHRIKTTIKAMIGEIILSTLIASGGIATLISFIFK